MIKIIQQHLIPALLALIVALVTVPFIESAIRLYNQITPAIEWFGIAYSTPAVKPGEILDIVYKAKINRQCPSDIRGFLIAPNNTVPVRFPTIAGGYTKPSNNIVEIKVSIPIPLESDRGQVPLISGQYIYRTLVTRYCIDGVEDDNHVPDVKFMLEVP